MKTKEDYEKRRLFPISNEQYKELLIKDAIKEKNKIKNQGGGYKLKLDKRKKQGDGIEILTGYNLSSVWSHLTHQQAKFYAFSIKLPYQQRSNLAISYSRTNLLEVERVIKTYMRKGDYFLESCCGWSTFGAMATFFGYSGIGIDIWDVALKKSQEQYDMIKELPDVGELKIMNMDGMNLAFKNETFSYVYCNPPFIDMELYSGDSNDIAHKDFDVFLGRIELLLRENKRVLQTGGLMTITINDVRKEGILIPMQKHIIDCAYNAGLQLYDFVIAENPTGGSMIMRKREYKLKRTAKMHEYVITFIKN